MRVSILIALFIVGGFMASRFSPASDQEKKKPKSSTPSVGMKIKLETAKDILAGLASADFKKVSKNAKAMQGLNAVEEFVRGDSRAYRDQLDQFRYATRYMVRAADQKNLEGVTLAYTQMTISCVNCHKLLRK